MEDRYQHAQTDGHLDWTVGAKNFNKGWQPVMDQLRFHKGDGFTIAEHGEKPGPVRRLSEIDDALHKRLDGSPYKTVFDITSVKDGFSLAMQKIEVSIGGDRVINNARDLYATPYKFGVTDCSWLSEAAYAPEIDDDWVHNAHAQHLMFGSKPGYLKITRDQLDVGDLVFIDDDHHVALYAGRVPAYDNIECVIDTEPHDTGAPAGWPFPTLKTGVRYRPMIGNYYCAWQNVNGIGRVVEVNGKP